MTDSFLFVTSSLQRTRAGIGARHALKTGIAETCLPIFVRNQTLASKVLGHAAVTVAVSVVHAWQRQTVSAHVGQACQMNPESFHRILIIYITIQVQV